MAWTDFLPTIVRNLINDTSDNPTFDDDRILQSIITAGIIVTREYEFDTDYSFDFASFEVIPDPTDPDTVDNDFIALVALKAACILSLNSYQNAVKNAISVKDGDSSVSTGVGLGGYSDLLKNGPCGAYLGLLKDLSVRQGMNNGKAVLSPYSSSDYYSHGYYGDACRFFDWYLGR